MKLSSSTLPSQNELILVSPRDPMKAFLSSLDVDAVKDGPSVEQIRTEVEGRLRRAGMVGAVGKRRTLPLRR